MAIPPPAQVPMLSPAEMQILVSRTGLVLNPGQVADLVLAWRQIAGLIARLPQNRPLADDMALAFRLPPPEVAPPTGLKEAGGPGSNETKSAVQAAAQNAATTKKAAAKPRAQPKAGSRKAPQAAKPAATPAALPAKARSSRKAPGKPAAEPKRPAARLAASKTTATTRRPAGARTAPKR
jgi:hypothetical protein